MKPGTKPPRLLALVFCLDPKGGELALGAIRKETDLPLKGRWPGVASAREQLGGWLGEQIRGEGAVLDPSVRIHALIPRVSPAGQLTLPIWTFARRSAEERTLERISTAVAAVMEQAGDPTLLQELTSSIRADFAADPFSQRLIGDDARLRSLSDAAFAADGSALVPSVIALLPELFTLAELEMALASPAAASGESRGANSNFRRRIQEFLHRGVLREAVATRQTGDQERIGRPPRKYHFDPAAWHDWLLDRQVADGVSAGAAGAALTDLRLQLLSPAADPRSNSRPGLSWFLQSRNAQSQNRPQPASTEVPREPDAFVRALLAYAPESAAAERLVRLERVVEDLVKRLT